MFPLLLRPFMSDSVGSCLWTQIAFWDAQSTGNMINRLSADVLMVQQSLTGNIISALRNSFMVIGGTALVFTISPKLALVSIGMIPPVALAGITYSRCDCRGSVVGACFVVNAGHS